MNEQQDVNVVDLKARRPATVRILSGQAEWGVADWREYQGLWFHVNDTTAQKWIDTFLSLATTYKANLVLLPELSVPESTLGSVRRWSERTGGIVIAGSHYARRGAGYVAKSPVIIGGDIHFVEKLIPAPIETSPIHGYGLTPGRLLKVFENSAAGNFSVLICSDYLEPRIRSAMYSHDLDLLCVPAFQRNSTPYHDRMSIDCDESQNGLYIAYSNSLCSRFGDGRTALFGQMDNLFVDKLQRANATDRRPPCKLCELSTTHHALVVDVSLDVKRPFAKHSIHTRPNVVLVERVSIATTRRRRSVAAD